ncbi:MAG: hypothetical protein ACKOT0_03125 [bacterium]
MSVICAGFIPAAPLLVPLLAGSDVARDERLREAVRTVVGDVVGSLRHGASSVVVIGPASETSSYAGTWDFSRLGLRLRGDGPGTLPTPLGVAAWFLDDAGTAAPREYVGVSDRAPAAACATLGRSLAEGRDIALLVVGDGSARRDEKAPGYLDPRAADFDARAVAALASGDPEALLALEPDLARELLAAGRAPWQVAAGAAQEAAPADGWTAQVLLEEAPYGVEYVVARWRRP